MATPTVRSLAKELHLSRTTVSDALRGRSRVHPDTVRKIREAAIAAGYNPNPLTSAVMSEMRKSRDRNLRGTIAAVLFDATDCSPQASRYFNKQIEGATQRAAELGFELKSWVVGHDTISLSDLDLLLQRLQVYGLIILPVWSVPSFLEFDWSRYAAIYMDYIIKHPPLHTVSCDHYQSIYASLQELSSRGYKRPGLFLKIRQDSRLNFHWESGFVAFQHHYIRDTKLVPPLLSKELLKETFMAWFRRHNPDVVLAHSTEVMTWMRECGAKIPQTHGFFCLNTTCEETRCAGINQRPDFIGATAVEIVVAQLHRNERGLPRFPIHSCIPSRFVDGLTIRKKTSAVAAVPG